MTRLLQNNEKATPKDDTSAQVNFEGMKPTRFEPIPQWNPETSFLFQQEHRLTETE